MKIKPKLKFLIPILFFILVLPAFAKTQEVMEKIINSWVGYSIDDVISQWGYPDEERTIAGKKLCYWHRERTVYVPEYKQTTTYDSDGLPSTSVTTDGGRTASYYCTRILELDDNHIVKTGSWKGGDCPIHLNLQYKSKWLNQRPPKTYNNRNLNENNNSNNYKENENIQSSEKPEIIKQETTTKTEETVTVKKTVNQQPVKTIERTRIINSSEINIPQIKYRTND